MNRFWLAPVAAVAFVSAPLLAEDSPVQGVWQIRSETPIGMVPATFTFSRTETGFDLAIDEPGVENQISDVKVEGTNFSFKREISFGGGGMTLLYTGTVSGDTLTATGKSDSVEIKVAGKRA